MNRLRQFPDFGKSRRATFQSLEVFAALAAFVTAASAAELEWTKATPTQSGTFVAKWP